MPEKEVKLSEWLHLPDVSSRENLITYKRRRVTTKSPKPAESSETLMKWKIKKKGRDMGWAYGKMINGNRQHWQCNWCGLTRYGGGVTRLKRHIAGDMDVRQCPNAPSEVVKEVRHNLIICDTIPKKKKKKKNKEVLIRTTGQECPDKVKIGKEIIDTESTKNDDPKKEDCNKEKLWESWRVILEDMLKMPDGSGSGGVQTSIHNVLSRNGPLQCNQVDSGILTKWNQALVDIFSNEKFRLLCTLLWTNFGDLKNDYGCHFDFSQINTSMKEGDYDRSPELFHQDIQKVWEKFKRIGHELVDLATSLSGFSRATIEKQMGSTELDNSKKDSKVDLAMAETKSTDSNTLRKSTSFVWNATLNQVELEPSQSDMCDYKCGTCSYCNLPIGEWEHISCTGCNLTYHLACVNPFTEDGNLNNTWYCSVCVSGTPIQSVTEVQYPILNLDARNSSENPVRTDPSEVCKICRAPKEQGGVLLTCSRQACPHKYYHRRCLRKRQRPNATQAGKLFWYCPSCRCNTCLANKDDHLIVSCAGCDKSYHTYCMDPSLDSVPHGKWYCNSCHGDRETEREGMREYKRENGPENSEIYEPMKMLICALESLEGQESLG
ncbi:Zinc finger protein DPF3 [Rhynchospora pubera]|uniref:Zinc finger protein DPF3 n=1 Tax=Rhynchospora pubera TaxID=906938 RepID=A0AAV8G0T9_9POAL|nr:Zinc finger protein DPF3 [Rhynchospora pubera]